MSDDATREVCVDAALDGYRQSDDPSAGEPWCQVKHRKYCQSAILFYCGKVSVPVQCRNSGGATLEGGLKTGSGFRFSGLGCVAFILVYGFN